MSDVKIAPKQRSFYENFDRIFSARVPCVQGVTGSSEAAIPATTTPRASASLKPEQEGAVSSASEIRGVLESMPRTPLIAPDSTGRASSAPCEAANHDAGKDGSPAGLIRQPSEFDSPTRYQHITDPNGPRLAFTVANSFTGDWFGFVL